MKKILIGIAIMGVLFAGCQKKPTIDLAKLNLTEKAVTLIDYDDRYMGGVNTIGGARAFALEASKSTSFLFNGKPLDTVGILFLMRSDKIRKDTSNNQGGGTVGQERIQNEADFNRVTKRFEAADYIYGYRITIKKKAQQDQVLTELIKLYGRATKNPNTDKGLYWNLKKEQKLVMFNPEYLDFLIVNYKDLSKKCFADFCTGLIDMGGCNVEQYVADLYK